MAWRGVPGRSFLVGWLKRADPKGRAKCGKIVRRVAASESGSGAVARAEFEGRAVLLDVRVLDRVVKAAAYRRSGSGPCNGCDMTGDMTRWSKEQGRDQVV